MSKRPAIASYELLHYEVEEPKITLLTHLPAVEPWDGPQRDNHTDAFLQRLLVHSYLVNRQFHHQMLNNPFSSWQISYGPTIADEAYSAALASSPGRSFPTKHPRLPFPVNRPYF